MIKDGKIYTYTRNYVKVEDVVKALKNKDTSVKSFQGTAVLGDTLLRDVFLDKEVVKYFQDNFPEEYNTYINWTNNKLCIGKILWHIDEPNQSYEVIREQPVGYFYVALFHPTFKDIKHIKAEDMGKTFFAEREQCLDARVERAKRALELEISFKERKI